MPLIKYNNQSLSSITALPSAIPTGKLKLISSQTASNSASISFTTGLNSTYKVYKFVFSNIHARTDTGSLTFNMSTDGGSNYNVTKTTTAFHAYHNEADNDAGIEYLGGVLDLAQSTDFAWLSDAIGNGADESGCGELSLYNPSSTTYVKHFISKTQIYYTSDYSTYVSVAGYGNTTSAVNAVRFQVESGNFDGTIKMYGVKKS